MSNLQEKSITKLVVRFNVNLALRGGGWGYNFQEESVA